MRDGVHGSHSCHTYRDAPPSTTASRGHSRQVVTRCPPTTVYLHITALRDNRRRESTVSQASPRMMLFRLNNHAEGLQPSRDVTPKDDALRKRRAGEAAPVAPSILGCDPTSWHVSSTIELLRSPPEVNVSIFRHKEGTVNMFTSLSCGDRHITVFCGTCSSNGCHPS